MGLQYITMRLHCCGGDLDHTEVRVCGEKILSALHRYMKCTIHAQCCEVGCAPKRPTALTTTSLMWSKAKACTEGLLLLRHISHMPIFITMTPAVPPAVYQVYQ